MSYIVNNYTTTDVFSKTENILSTTHNLVSFNN